MGAANVIPGVSGGTIALITGIFERIIDAIKNLFGVRSMRLLFSGKLKEWATFTDFWFVLALGLGVAAAVASIARVLEYLFSNHPVQVWAFFFGLVLASVWFVGKTITRWNIAALFFFTVGAALAISMATFKPAGENRDVLYLLICGALAACSMILPGLSGSFVLILLGNYELVMIHSINELDLRVLLPVALGAGLGLLAFSYALSWIFKKFRDQTIAILSGFMLGSLLIIWPWKETAWQKNPAGEFILSRSGDRIVEKYNWVFPERLDFSLLVALALILCGVAIIVFTERLAAGKTRWRATGPPVEAQGD